MTISVKMRPGDRDGALLRYYEKQGFTRAETFGVPLSDSKWPGQVLFQRLFQRL